MKYNLNRQSIRMGDLTKPVYIAKKLSTEVDEYGNEKITYSTPKKYYFNIMPAGTNNSTDSDVQDFGEREFAKRVAVIRKTGTNLQEFNEFDVAYLDGVTPTGEVENGFNANYRIYAVQPQNAIIKIYFSKLIK